MKKVVFGVLATGFITLSSFTTVNDIKSEREIKVKKRQTKIFATFYIETSSWCLYVFVFVIIICTRHLQQISQQLKNDEWHTDS